jgi:hypothetical protein
MAPGKDAMSVIKLGLRTLGFSVILVVCTLVSVLQHRVTKKSKGLVPLMFRLVSILILSVPISMLFPRYVKL